MRMLLSILFLLSASLFRGTGQVREITGTVKCATGSLPGALVTVTTEADDHVLAYAVADAEGHFALKVAEAAQGLAIYSCSHDGAIRLKKGALDAGS